MTLIRVALAAVVCMLVLGGSAHAGRTERVVVAQFAAVPYDLVTDCSQYGAYDFDIAISGVQRGRITNVYAADGTLLRTIIQSGFVETGTNTETQLSVALRGSARDIIDHTTNTRTLSGNVAIGTQPGAGTYFQETGRITIDLATREALFVAGRHDALVAGGFDAALCAAHAGLS